MLKQKQFLLFKNSFVGIKTKIGAFFTLLVLTVFTWISIDTFKRFTSETEITETKISVDDLIENHLPINLTFAISFPKEIQDYGRWISGSAYNYKYVHNMFQESNDIEFNKYFPNTFRDANKTYICVKIENPSIYKNFVFKSCKGFNFYPDLYLKDATCNKTPSKILELTTKMYDKSYSSYNLYFASFNYTTRNYSYHNISLPLVEEKLYKISDANINLNKVMLLNPQ